jgi:hypothetical protein
MRPQFVDIGEGRRFFSAAIVAWVVGRAGPHLVLETLNLENTSTKLFSAGHTDLYRGKAWQGPPYRSATTHYARFSSGRKVRIATLRRLEGLHGSSETWFAPLPHNESVQVAAARSRHVGATLSTGGVSSRSAPRKPSWRTHQLDCPLHVQILDEFLVARGSVEVCLDATLGRAGRWGDGFRYNFTMCMTPPTPNLLPSLQESIAYHWRHGVDQFIVPVPLNTREAVLAALEPFIDRSMVTVVLADYTQNLNASESPGEAKLWPYYMLWGEGFPSFHGQHMLKNVVSHMLMGVSRFFKMYAPRPCNSR